EPVRLVLELHHGGLHDRRRPHAHPLRDLPETDHAIHHDHRPQIAGCITKGTEMTSFSGLGSNLSNLYRLSSAKTRSISPENFTGEKGAGGLATEGTGAIHARALGPDGSSLGWKVSPSIRNEPGETQVLADIDGICAI